MPAEGPLREDQRSIYGHLEDATGGLPEFDLRLRKGLLELGGQTGRPRLIASDDAVLDADEHDPESGKKREPVARRPWNLTAPPGLL